jgi:hypothetical protein
MSTHDVRLAVLASALSVGSACASSPTSNATAPTVAPVELTAPVQISPASGSVFNNFPRTTVFRWTTVGGAATYSLEFDGTCVTGTPLMIAPGCADPDPLGNFLHFVVTHAPVVGSECPPHPAGGEAECFTTCASGGVCFANSQSGWFGAQPGRWRVWVSDAGGRLGPKSPWWTFRWTI